MSLVIPPGFGLAAFHFSTALGTGPFVTTLGVDLANVGGDFVEAADQLMDDYAAAFSGITSNALDLELVQLTIGQDGPGGSVDSQRSPIPMTASGTINALAMSVIARKTTNRLGRAGRGRMFLPGVCAASGINGDGSLTTGYRSSVNGALDTFYDRLTNPVGDIPVRLPYLLHSEGLGIAPTRIEGFVTAPLVGWIRGRIY